MRNTLPNAQDADWKGKRKREDPDLEDPELNRPRKTCGKQVDYKQLNNPFPSDLDDNLLLR